MAKAISLTLAFVEKEPLAAGRELAAMSADEAAAFLDAIPTRLAAPVITTMGAWSVAAAVSKMPTASASAVLRAVDYLDAVEVLRSLSSMDRARLLSELPERLRTDFETSLAFPDDTVGANMSLTPMTMSPQHLVKDAAARMRRSSGDNADVVVIVDADRKLSGLVHATSLWRHGADTELGTIMDTLPRSISARARLTAVDTMADWGDYPALPVISRQHRVIGLLSRKSAVRSRQSRTRSSTGSSASVSVSMLDAYYHSFAGIARALIGIDASSAVAGRSGDDDEG